MKPRSDLAHLLRDYERQLNRFDRLFLSVVRKPDPLEGTKSDLNYIIIELLNGYRNFNRAFLLSCARGTRTTGKKMISVPGVKTEFDFVRVVFNTYSNKTVDQANGTWHSRDEPAWEADILRISQRLNLQNLIEIDAAFTNSSFYKKLKLFRNFCAHRSHSLFNEASIAAIQFNLTGPSIEKIVTTQMPGGGYLLAQWIDQCRNYARQICS